jgi:hypothetical protein
VNRLQRAFTAYRHDLQPAFDPVSKTILPLV